MSLQTTETVAANARRRRRIAIAMSTVVLTAVAIGLTRFLLPERRAAEQSTIPASQSTPPLSIPSIASSQPDAGAPPATTSVTLATTTSPERASRAGCGFDAANSVDQTETSAKNFESLQLSVAQGSAALRARLSASSDEYPVALAFALQAQSDFTKLLPECQTGHGCDEARLENKRQTSSGPVEKLAAMARNSKSGGVYGLAVRTCGLAAMHEVLPPSCQGVTNQRWAELAPDNAWAWLGAARDAQNRNDLSGLLTALNKASTATKWASPSTLAQSIALDYMPDTITGIPRASVLAQSQNLFLSHQASGLDVLIGFCAKAQDANVNQACTNLVQKLLNDSDSLAGLRAGLAIAQKVGLDPAKLENTQKEVTSLSQLAAKRLDWKRTANLSSNCTGLDQAIADLEAQAKFGEVRALRSIAEKHVN